MQCRKALCAKQPNMYSNMPTLCGMLECTVWNVVVHVHVGVYVPTTSLSLADVGGEVYNPPPQDYLPLVGGAIFLLPTPYITWVGLLSSSPHHTLPLVGGAISLLPTPYITISGWGYFPPPHTIHYVGGLFSSSPHHTLPLVGGAVRLRLISLLILYLTAVLKLTIFMECRSSRKGMGEGRQRVSSSHWEPLSCMFSIWILMLRSKGCHSPFWASPHSHIAWGGGTVKKYKG